MSIEKELRQNWDSVVYPEPDVDQQAMPPGYQEGDVLLAQARHPRTGRPMTGPTMSDVTEPAMGLLNMGASALKGVTQGFLGLPGELEALVYGAKELLTRRADESAFDAFINGLKKETILPTTEEVKKWLDTNVGEVPGVKTFETLGETIAPGGQYKAVKAGAKALKNMPVGMSTEAVGGMQKVLTPPNATAPTSDIGFFSAVEQAALNIKRNSGTGQAMLNDITKGENVKSDEIKWIGLDEFLAGKKNVTKQEVQDFIAANKVDVQEVTLDDAVPQKVTTDNITDYFDESTTPNGDPAVGIFKMSYGGGDGVDATNFTAYEVRGRGVELYDNNGNFVDEYPTLTDARQYVINDSEFEATQASGNTKFGAYTLPGGENYREILLTMPSKNPEFREWDLSRLTNLANKKRTPDEDIEYKTLAKRYDASLRGETEKEYRSSHWEQPNVLAHIRVNDRVDADGKKMLLVEEVQSDWHQAGRDKGYGPKMETSVEAYYISDSGRRISLGYGKTQEEAAAAVDPGWNNLVDIKFDTQTRKIGEGVPDAPMKDTWYQLALKRVLKYAADNGYERVGLTTGSRQAERYDLSKQIDSIKFNKMPDGNIFWTAYKNGERAIGNDSSPSELASQVGKDLAKKIIEHEGPGEFSGIDLQVGGEGMKKYYDDIYPNYLQKYGKKWGAKVGETSIQADGKEPVRYIDITPEMRKSVGKGQPLFTATGLATGTGAGTMATSQQEPK